MAHQETIKTTVTRLDERVKTHTKAINSHSKVIGELNGKIDTIMTNDLPHLREGLALSRQRLSIVVGVLSAIGVKVLDLLFG